MSIDPVARLLTDDDTIWHVTFGVPPGNILDAPPVAAVAVGVVWAVVAVAVVRAVSVPTVRSVVAVPAVSAVPGVSGVFGEFGVRGVFGLSARATPPRLANANAAPAPASPMRAQRPSFGWTTSSVLW